MNNNRLNFLLTITVIFVFILSLFSTINVLADDSTPPAPTETPVVDAPPTDLPTVEPVTTEVPVEEPAAEEDVNVAEILTQMPEGTDLVVLDENGEAQPLSTQEAADILVVGDPQWCMEGYTPADDPTGGTYCTAKFSSFNGVGGLIEELTNGAGIDSGNGTIYVAYDYDASVAGDTGGIYLDYSATSLGGLVFQGGWNFSSNTVAGTTTFNDTQLWFDGWSGGLTIQDIMITNANGSSFVDCAYGSSEPSNIGLVVTCGYDSVNLNNVSVNTSEVGAYVESFDDVTIENSHFDNNTSAGVVVFSADGDISLNNVIALNNIFDGGAYIEGYGDVTITNSDFSGNGTDPSSEARGLTVYADGDINLTNVSASGNAGGGAELDNSLGYGNITLTGTNVFNNNGFNLAPSVGLWAISSGNITLGGVTASGNGLGAGGGAFFLTDAGNISIVDSNFSNNCIFLCDIGIGFFAGTNGGNITLNQVVANGNGDTTNGTVGLGALIFNNSGNVFVRNSDFNNNCALGLCGGGGLEIMASSGNVYLDHVNANGNGSVEGGGAFILTNGGNVEIYCSSFSNNAGEGLVVDIPGGSTLTLGDITFGGNATGDFELFDGTLIVDPFGCEKKKIPFTNLPLNLVNVTSGQSVELDCEHYGGTKLILENGDSTTLPCPIKDSASIVNNKVEDLPNPLPEGAVFQSAFTTSASKNGEKLDKLSTYATISFMIPDGADTSKLAILFWNGTEWIEVDSTFVRNDPVTGESYFEAYVNYTGTFVLVQK